MSDGKRRNSQVWKEIKPFAMLDLSKAISKSGGGGNEYSILLYKASGKKISKYSVTSSGLAAALAGGLSGDVVWVPAATISGSQSVPAGVKLVGASRKGTVLTGQVTLASGSSLENLTVKRTVNSGGAIYGVIDGGGTAYIQNCTIDVSNSGAGGAYAIYLASAGVFYVYDSDLLALTGTDGYAVYITDGALYQMGGRAKGTITLMPYYY